MLIDERDLAIVRYISEHPMASYAEIAEALHFRPETVSKHIEVLRKNGIYYRTAALLSYRSLDMLYVPVLVRADLLKLPKIYEVLRAHPYIQYSVRCIGGTDGAFAVFTIPSKSLNLLATFFDELAARGVIRDYRLFLGDSEDRAFGQPDFTLFSPEDGTWNFNWQKWQENHPPDDPPARITPVVEPGLRLLEKTDIDLLNIISWDINTPTNEIATKVGQLPHQVRRRIQFFEDKGFVVSYRPIINFSKFHLYSSIMFNCNATPESTEKCRIKMLSLPFPMTFIPVQNGFLAPASLPPEGLPPVHEVLAKYCSDVEISWFDFATSQVEPLNAKAFEGNSWKNDHDFLVRGPLKLVE